MAITQAEVQVQWSSVDSLSLTTAAGNATSDAITADATCIDRVAVFKADNSTTPADGDTVDFYLLASLGDPDDSPGTDEYTTPAHAKFLARLDTFSTNGEDPAVSGPVALPATLKGYKIYAVTNAAANSITISCTTYEKRSA